MDWRTASLGLIPAIVLLVFVILLPVIGYFAGYKRALYWTLGNILFASLGWIIWVTSYEGILNGIFGMIPFDLGSWPITELYPIINAVVAPIWYLIWIIGGNLILLIMWYALFKWLLRLSKKKKYENFKDKASLKAESSFIKRNQIISRASGAAIMFLGIAPIASSVANTASAFTVSNAQRQENGFVEGMYKFAGGLSKINFTSMYYSDTTTHVDAILAFANNPDIVTKLADTFAGEDIPVIAGLKDAMMGFQDAVNDYFENYLNLDETDLAAYPGYGSTAMTTLAFWDVVVDDMCDEVKEIFNYQVLVHFIHEWFAGNSITNAPLTALYRSPGDTFDWSAHGPSNSAIDDWENGAGGQIVPLETIFKSFPMCESLVNAMGWAVGDDKLPIELSTLEQIDTLFNMKFDSGFDISDLFSSLWGDDETLFYMILENVSGVSEPEIKERYETKIQDAIDDVLSGAPATADLLIKDFFFTNSGLDPLFAQIKVPETNLDFLLNGMIGSSDEEGVMFYPQGPWASLPPPDGNGNTANENWDEFTNYIEMFMSILFKAI